MIQMQRWLTCLAAIIVVITVSNAFASDDALEVQMAAALSGSVQCLEQMQQQGPNAALFDRLKAMEQELRNIHLLLEDKFVRRQKRLDSLNSKASQRHQSMRQAYSRVIDDYLDEMADLKQAGQVNPALISKLMRLLKPAVPTKQPPIYGHVPYTHIAMAAAKPDKTNTVLPAYLDPNARTTPEDLEPGEFAPKSEAIVQLAESLDWNPIKIFEWMKNNVATEWYWGVMKGAEDTLRQKSGNDCDQAALLVALLRASGYPSRFVRGLISFYPDATVARGLMGVDDDLQLLRYLQLAGIPHEVTFSGQRIETLAIEHIWVETQVPYANYRGAVIDAHGKTWVGLDSSIKAAGFDDQKGNEILSRLQLSPLRDLYLEHGRDDSPLEFVRAELESQLSQLRAGVKYSQLLRSRAQRRKDLKILPNALQFNAVQITAEYAQLPPEMGHRISFKAQDAQGNLFFDYSTTVAKLSNQIVQLTYEPQSVDDQEIINSFGGLDNTPAYLIRLRPVIAVNRQRTAIGAGGLPAGEPFTLTITLQAPNGQQRQFTNTHIMGNLALIDVAAQNAAQPTTMAPEEKDATRILQEAASQYILQWNLAEEELANLMQVNVIRPMPTVVTTGGILEVTQLLDQPHITTWKGVFVDADFRSIETVGGAALDSGAQAQKIFMQLAALEGADLEAKVLEENFQVDAIATPRLIGLAHDQQTSMIRIDNANINSVLPGLNLPPNLKTDISDAVNQRMEVRIPAANITFEDWSGTGYIKENPETGEAGYMLTGMIAGGMTAWGLDRWPEYYRNRMIYEYSGDTNDDPNAGVELVKVSITDMQTGVAGKLLDKPLQVVVRDDQGKPVVGASVIFTAKAGGGHFIDGSLRYEAKSNAIGVASAKYLLGTRTDANPAFWLENGKTYPQKVGENIISAALEQPLAKLTVFELPVPFTAYGLPGEPAAIKLESSPDIRPAVLIWTGYLKASVFDAYGNPIANQLVTFEALPAIQTGKCLQPMTDNRQALLFNSSDPCTTSHMALWGECLSAETTKQVLTQADGAYVNKMTGGWIYARYPFAVSLGNLRDQIEIEVNNFGDIHPTGTFGNCGRYNAGPSWDFVSSINYSVDANGNILNAAAPGGTVELNAQMYFIREEYINVTGCGTCPKTEDKPAQDWCCSGIQGTRTFNYSFEMGNPSFLFKVLDVDSEDWFDNVLESHYGTYLGEGKFIYNHTVLPGVNLIDAMGIVERAEYPISGGIDCSSRSCVPNRTGSFSGQATNPFMIVVFGVTITTDPQIDMNLDEAGRSTCDISIKYDIQPHEYKTANAFLLVYRKEGNDPEELIAAIPTEGQGQSQAFIGRGFQFDENVDYTAQIVLNPNTRFEIKSPRIKLQRTEIRIDKIYIEDYKAKGNHIPAGDSRNIIAVTSPSNRSVEWQIIHKDDGVKAEIVSKSTTTVKIAADKETGNGWIKVRATDKDNICIYKEAMIYVGCPSCGAGFCDTSCGTGEAGMGSIDLHINLGAGQGGAAAGQLFIRSEQPDASLYTPAGLFLSTTTNEIQPRYDDNKLLRQVMAAETLADIRVIDGNAYTINFYRPKDVAGEANGLYTLSGSAAPFAVWRIENPNPGTVTQLNVTETRDGKIRENLYFWDAQIGAWSLSKANGTQLLSRTEEKSDPNRTVTETIKDSHGNISSRTRTTYRKFEWGEEIVQTVVDPGGAALTTTTEYYSDPAQTGSYSRIKSQTNPNGSWQRYEYDAQGRKTLEITPWLDSPAGAPAASARAVAYSYEPVDSADSSDPSDTYRPRTITETILGQVVGKTYNVYSVAPTGERTEITERAASASAGYGQSGNQRTISQYYASNTGLPESGRLHSSVHPDGRQDVYLYSSGTYFAPAMDSDPGTYTMGSGTDLIAIALHGTLGHPQGIAFKTTREVTVSSQFGRTLLQTTDIYTGSGYEQIQWQTQRYDDNGRVIATFASDGAATSSIWSCCGKESETDATGRTTLYGYDDLNRVTHTTQKGAPAGIYPAQADIKTIYTYDAQGRTTQTQTLAGDLSQTTRSGYDRTGRLQSSIDPAGLQTRYDYSADTLTTTVTQPGGATQITTRHRDGRTQSVTGTAGPAQYYFYGVNPDGSQYTEVRTGSPGSPLYQRTTTDMLGRTLRVEKPGPQTVEVSANFYDAQGRLARTTQTGQVDTLYVYDELGNPVRTGLDIDGNGQLEPASLDRISDSDTAYINLNNTWWQQTIQRTYPNANDPTAVTIATQRTRLSGLIENNLRAESIAIDLHGNTTISRTLIDRDAQIQTQTIAYPDSTIEARTITVNGRVMESRSKTGITTTFDYDPLGRQTSATDGRTGAAVTHYDDQGRVDYTRDAAQNRTDFGYDPATGRKISQTDALGKTTRFAYTPQGQISRTWGDVPYPVKYDYDPYGRLSAMTTYRTDAGFDADTFPANASGDITRWHYDEATGLLLAKEYADGSQITYTYTSGGRLRTRTWARLSSGQPLVTTYAYDPATAELTGIDYSDTTPEISFVYDRLGRQHQISDAAGTRTFVYNDHLQLESETIAGLSSATITRDYDTVDVPGRATGLTLDSSYTIDYGYDPATGRFNNVAWNIAGQSGSAAYCYLGASDLLQQITTPTGLQTIYAYEPHRNLKTQVQNRFNANLVSQYDYQYDPVGRRSSVVNSGSAFAQAAYSAYGYNDRSELISSKRYQGTDIANTAQPVAAEQRGYLYDAIGNRTRATEAGVQTTYSANRLNQYTAISGPDAFAPAYDADGNMQNGPNGMRYTYDAENRLIEVVPQSPASGDSRVEFVYDYMGRRIKKSVSTFSSGSWLPASDYSFLYDGWNLIKQTTTPANATSVDKYFVWGLDLSQTLQGAGGVGGLLASVQGSLTYNYFFDANGNVGQVVEAGNGSLAAHYEYDPYGNEVRTVGPLAGENEYRFSTKYYDEETNLYYYGYRYYLPWLGRWITRDPLEKDGDTNVYLANSNDFINKYDIVGLYWEWAVNGTSAHISFFEWLKAEHPKGKLFVYDMPLSSYGIGWSMNRPDVVDRDRGLVWELKPISHNTGPNSDYIQMSKYLLETGFCPGDPKELVPKPATRAYPIVDVFGNEREVFLYPGQHGFIYYEFGNPEPLQIKKEILDSARKGLENLFKGAVILGGIIIIVTG